MQKPGGWLVRLQSKNKVKKKMPWKAALVMKHSLRYKFGTEYLTNLKLSLQILKVYFVGTSCFSEIQGKVCRGMLNLLPLLDSK